MKTILLVEPPYQSLYPPLGLMKISTWHKKRGDIVDYIKHKPSEYKQGLFKKDSSFFQGYYNPYRKKYDVIYITSLFTYYYQEVIDTINYYKKKYPNTKIKVGGILATLLPEQVYRDTGIQPHIGLLDKTPNIEACAPDYSLAPNIDYSISFTTRGCVNNCPFCAVKIHEPDYFVKEHWERDINLQSNKIVFWDNNWFCSNHFVSDIAKLTELKRKGVVNIDFNQGLDCRLFTEEIAEAMKGLPIKPLRFAFDNESEEGHIQRAVRLAQKHNFKDIRIYVLYNSDLKNDTPEYFYTRINKINKMGAFSYPMRFRPLNAINISQCQNYISNNWDKELLRALKLSLMFFYTEGMISDKKDAFNKIYGRNAMEFISKLRIIYKNDKKRNKKRKKLEGK